MADATDDEAAVLRRAAEVLESLYGTCKPEEFYPGCAGCQARWAMEFLRGAAEEAEVTEFRRWAAEDHDG